VRRHNLFWKLIYLCTAGAVFLIDQATKSLAAAKLRGNEDVTVIGGLLNFSYATNTGVAFSIGAGNGDLGAWGLSAIGILAGALVVFFIWRTPRIDDRMLGGLTLILGGIAGNVTDRIRFGFVIDFIDVQFGNWHYPTFNIADMAICIGAGLIILDTFLSKKSQVE